KNGQNYSLNAFTIKQDSTSNIVVGCPLWVVSGRYNTSAVGQEQTQENKETNDLSRLFGVAFWFAARREASV
ncbi:hypothetical protein, partial [Massilia sp.]|uniref:hypothetical protein n=1 Tax=Massilia sp. TaxID=1882437 RepID=UPI0028AAD547